MLGDEIEIILGFKLTSLIEVTKNHLLDSGTTLVGIVASPSPLKARLFQESLVDTDVKFLTPTKREEKQTENIIRAVIAGAHPTQAQLSKILSPLFNRGAERVILGCTELSVVGDDLSSNDVIDPLKLVTEEIFKS